MYFHAQTWINDIADGEPDPAAANALQGDSAGSSARCAP